MHKCATYEAVSIIEKRVAECFQFGIARLEVIYGTPDNYEGSIQQAITLLADQNELVENETEIHAGTILSIKHNKDSIDQDDSMSFSGISASYESRFKAHGFERDYTPFRKEVQF